MFTNGSKIFRGALQVFQLCFVREIDRRLTRTLSTSETLFRKGFDRTPFKFTTKGEYDTQPKAEEEVIDESETVEDESTMTEFIHRTFRTRLSGHQVFVIQPCVVGQQAKETKTTAELQLAEAVTLTQTLINWKVVDSLILTTKTPNSAHIFNTSKREYINERISRDKRITAVFISVNMLTETQLSNLETEFKVPIFDRYNIVIQIFREHAKTHEAKLQIQLAEIPYLWARLKTHKENSLSEFGKVANMLGGGGFLPLDTRRLILRKREARLKKELSQLKEHRQLLRKNRIEMEFPTIAVVGYTNAGKTSLIKTLTGKKSLDPQNYLFATLDVTAHAGILPSTKLKVLYIDTIGFISDIPTFLMESFIATLEDALIADVIVHVLDVSHPDAGAQNQVVADTLSSLNLSYEMKKNVITVANKSDLMSEEEISEFRQMNPNMLLISADKQIGTGLLCERIEQALLSTSKRKVIVIRVQTGKEEYNWLHKEATVSEVNPDPKNSQYSLVKVIMTDSLLEKFKHHFIRKGANG